MQKQPERTGDKGIQLICQFEGLRLERYRDAVGLWTIGYGHLILKEEMEKLTKITTGEAKDLLRKDLKRTEDGVKKLLNTLRHRTNSTRWFRSPSTLAWAI
jgi:GH24 family phage-related lysozyme (muramidase)